MSVVAQAQAVGGTDTWYHVLLYLHILTAIIGLGTVFLNGLRAADAAKRGGRDELAVNESQVVVSRVGEYFIYAIFVTGLIMGIAADEPVSLGDFWLSASMLLFIIGIGISHGLLMPAEKKVNAAMAAELDGEGGAEDVDVDALTKRIAASGATLDLLVIVILYLMVWKPGLT